MRSVISILLLFLMLLQAAGHLVFFKIQQYEIRCEIKQRIKLGAPDHELVLIKIPKTLEEKPRNIFQRIAEGEFRCGGNMYDIIRRETHGDTTWYYCLADEKEAQLFANMDELIKQDLSQNAKHKQQMAGLLQWLGSLFFGHHDNAAFVHAVEETESTNYFFRLKIWSSPSATPAPKTRVLA
jgi:hypothetical protein